MTIFSNNFVANCSQNFYCELCDYTTSKKCNMDKHVMTSKHKKTTLDNDLVAESTNKTYTCENCEKKFNDRSGLWRHNKKCLKNEEIKNKEIKNEEIKNEDIEEMKEFMKYLMKENSEMKNMMMEVIKNGTHNTNTNINSNNKTFNLQVFLNETCKDAMNIMDFIDSIKIQLEDLEDVGKLGYVNGISNIIMKNLKALDVTQRPVHCSDSKRETLYVKDQDKWEKEDETNTRLRRAIKRIAYKNTKIIRDWRDIHPDHDNSFSKTSDIYQQIVIESMGGKYYETTDTEAKIIKNIAKHVVIDK